MSWFTQLFQHHSVEQTVIIYAIVICIGIVLGRVKIFGIAFGITWILFVGLLASYMGATVNDQIRSFLKDFGLILFVYYIGLQVGPGFFASLKQKAIVNNLLAAGTVALGVIITIILYFVSKNHIGLMAGIMSGAVTNTPGLGAAQSTLADLNVDFDRSMVTLAYAVAYPFGVVGIILSMIVLRRYFKISVERETRLQRRLVAMRDTRIVTVHLRLENPQLAGEPLSTLRSLLREPVIITRMMRNESVFTPSADIRFAEGDIMLVVTPRHQLRQLKLLVGDEISVDLRKISQQEIADATVVVTKPTVTHVRMGEIPELNGSDFRISRLNRGGIELIARPDMYLQLGDTARVVGTRGGVERVAKALGNSLTALDVPDLAPIFLGIVLGVVLGSIPIAVPGMPSPMKIGLAGGPLVVALVLSRFGSRFFLNNYATSSANMMMRELGITLFLASIGLGSGASLSAAFEGGRGFYWMGMGAIITMVPLLVMGYIAKRCFKKTYFEICGLMAGSATDPPALAFAIKSTGSDVPTTAYATIYPLTMILRIVAAQLLIILFV